MQVEAYVSRIAGDDRVVLPIGSTEQHAYLSLGTDSILAERVAVEAAEPLGVLVLPAMPFGIAPGFAAFPGTVSLRAETLAAVLTETLDTLHGQGFRGFLVVNGHGGNLPAQGPLEEWARGRADARLRFHSWWDSPAVREVAERIHPEAAHASWFENFPWTRLAESTSRPATSLRSQTAKPCVSSSPTRCARRSATARTAAPTPFRTKTPCASGQPASPRSEPLIEALS